MVARKMVETWELSDDNKKAIKEKAQKLKDFLAINDAITFTEFYDWCDWCEYDFLGYIEKILPFVKEERKYISKGDIKKLIHEIDSVVENVNTSLSVDDFKNEYDIIKFFRKKYINSIEFAKKILEVCDKDNINKLINAKV